MDLALRCLKTHLDTHPAAELPDAVKFLFQSCLGPGHIITNPAATLSSLASEAKALPNDHCAPYFEPLGDMFTRVDLAVLHCVTLDTLHTMFVRSAPDAVQPDTAHFSALLDELVESEAFFPGRREEKAAFVARYKEQGFPVARHSAAYRAAYNPAYRVVRNEYVYFFRIFSLIDAFFQRHTQGVLAIDGSCASGKTTLAALLTTVYSCNVFHMDDFFLPPELRTSERLLEPGGNVHYERFQREVLVPLRQKEPFSYRVFDCKTMDFGNMCSVVPKRLSIVEGAYAMHPSLTDAYDLRVFLRTPYETQCARIAARNGSAMLQRFQEEWIPLENRYFEACAVKDGCDLVFET